jgi:very-short-patch-repair endonuclease
VELDGPEHRTLEEVIERDKKKNEICKKNNFKLIRVENVYARRYNEIKQILVDHFSSDV